MRAEPTDDHYVQSSERKSEQAGEPPMLSPARRAALDALERELHDLLRSR